MVNPTVPVPEEDSAPDDQYDLNKCTENHDLNDNIYYLYLTGSPEYTHTMANVLLDLENTNPKSYYLAMQVYKALLNSGTMHHIINDRALFQTFDKSKVIPIKTTNCGILNTFVMGKVHFRKNISGQTATVIL